VNGLRGAAGLLSLMWNCSPIIPSGTSTILIRSTLKSSPHKATTILLPEDY